MRTLILVLDGGRLIAQGQHEELLQNCGLYAEIFYSQLRPEERKGLAEPAHGAVDVPPLPLKRMQEAS